MNPLSDPHNSLSLVGGLLICGCKPQMLCRSLTSKRSPMASTSTSQSNKKAFAQSLNFGTPNLQRFPSGSPPSYWRVKRASRRSSLSKKTTSRLSSISRARSGNRDRSMGTKKRASKSFQSRSSWRRSMSFSAWTPWDVESAPLLLVSSDMMPLRLPFQNPSSLPGLV